MSISNNGTDCQVTKLKELLRKYAPIRHATYTQCPACHNYGLFTHKDGCELAEYLTPTKPKSKGRPWDQSVTPKALRVKS